MISMLKIIVLLFIISSCGKIKVEPTKDVNFGPSFDKAIEICNKFYGVDTPKAESCFDDYRNYFNVKVKLDLMSILDFCSSEYVDSEQMSKCINDLKDLFGNINWEEV